MCVSCRAACCPAELIEQARRRMQETPSVRESSIMLESLLGEGTFGKVYSGEHGGPNYKPDPFEADAA